MSTPSSSRDSSSSTNSQSSRQKPPNVVFLRRALRLVHCLQKERGASGAYCAALTSSSSSTTLLTPTSTQHQLPEAGVKGDGVDAAAAADALGVRVGTLDAMESARQSTDAAILLFNSLVNDPSQQQRQNHRCYREPLPIPVSATLQKVRALLPNTKRSGGLHNTLLTTATTTTATTTTISPTTDHVGFHRILVCFNTLIATVVQECILRHTSVAAQHSSGAMASRRQRGAGNALSGSSSFSSFSVLQMQQQQPKQHQQQHQPPAARSSSIGPLQGGGGGMISTSHLIPPRVIPTTSVQGNMNHRSLRSDRLVQPSSDPSRMEYFFHDVSAAPPETLVPITGGGGGGEWKQQDSLSVSPASTNSVHNNSNNTPCWSILQQTQQQQQPPNDVSETAQPAEPTTPSWMELLQLLDCFTRLKESTGMERAMLCSILAAGQVDAVWLNDLIVQVENQRKLVEELNELCGIVAPTPALQPSPPLQFHHANQQQQQQHQQHNHLQSLQHLVQDVVHMNPNLQALQNKILTDCNLEGLNYQQPNGLWDLLSTYIDKLHSLELLILEELEYCLPPPQSPATVAMPPSATGVTPPSQSTVDAMEEQCISKPLAVNNDPRKVSCTSSEHPIEAPLTTASSGTPAATSPPTTAINNNNNNNSNHSFQILEQLFFAISPLAGDAMHHIQAMSSDQVKAKLLEILDLKNRPLNTSSSDAAPQEQQHPLEKPDDDDTQKNHPHDNNRHQNDQHTPASPKPKRVLENKDSILDPLDPWNTAGSTITSKEWEINLYEITFQKRIGRGASGTTYQAKWSGQRVAVKVASITEMGLEGWRTEVQALQKLHHSNIIRLLGSVCNPSPLTYCLVLEYCSAGDLAGALQQSTPRQFFSTIASGMAHGMAYLHSRDIIHRDIKPSNVLLDGDLASGHFVVKVSDFGVATTQAFNREDRTAETGTYRWMAPEVIRHEAYSHMADVYSYALVLWQLLTRENPFANVSPISAAGKVALEGARPPFPFGTPRAVQELIQTCWQEVPESRLPFDRIAEILVSEVMPLLTPEETVWLESSHGHAVYARGLPHTVDSHRPVAVVAPPPPQQQLVPILHHPPAATPVGKDSHSDGIPQHEHHPRSHQPSNDQPLHVPLPPADKRGSFRRIFPKLARN